MAKIMPNLAAEPTGKKSGGGDGNILKKLRPRLTGLFLLYSMGEIL